MKQIYPSSITGKGAVGTGTPPSVLEHRFGKGDPYTLGVEEEYMLLDPETWDLVQHIDSVLSAVADGEHEDRINAELMQSVLEVTTPVCQTADDVHRALAQLRAYVAGIARDQGCRFGSAGTHPFSLFERQRITARDRYRQLVDQLQYVARRELIFGMHMHVAVDDPGEGDPGDERRARPPAADARAVGLVAVLARRADRARIEPADGVRRVPTLGPAAALPRLRGLRGVVGQLERTGCIADYTHIWWDIRPHPRLGTIEMRVCDAVTRLEDVVAITAFFQAIVKMYCEQYESGKEVPSWHRMLTTENKWLAARYGLEAPVMDLATGRRNRVPVAQLIRRTLRDVEPHARELGSERELEGVREMLARGNGADRQLRVWNANRDIVEVVREISAATEEAAARAAAA